MFSTDTIRNLHVPILRIYKSLSIQDSYNHAQKWCIRHGIHRKQFFFCFLQCTFHLVIFSWQILNCIQINTCMTHLPGSLFCPVRSETKTNYCRVSHTCFFYTKCQLHLFNLSFDWLTGLSLPFAIGWLSYQVPVLWLWFYGTQ